MEKRLLLATFLSFLVVYFWSNSLKTRQPDLFTSTNREYPIETMEPKVDSEEQPLSQTSPEKEIIQKPEIEESLSVLENDNILVELTNAGGVIKKIRLKNYDAVLPINNILALEGFEENVFDRVSFSKNQIIYSFETESILVTKQFSLAEDDFIVKANIEVYNKTEMSKKENLNINAYTVDMSILDIDLEKKGRQKTQNNSLLEYVVFSDNKMHRKNNAFKFKDKEFKKSDGNVEWIGYRDRYFCSIVKPEYETKGYVIQPLNENILEIGIQGNEIVIPAQSSVELQYSVFSGPEKIDLLKKYEANFELIKRYYRIGLLDAMAKFMNAVLQLLYKIIPVWGICIILMSVIVYFSMYPLTVRGMVSMKKMQSLQPEITKIKEKYKNDQQKANMEVMELYKKNKINPLGGCLPMLLQMPVFIGLYQVLWRSVSFKGSSFLWIKDLSQPDRLFPLPFTIPIVDSSYFNLLPFLMMIIMFFQQKLSAKNMVLSDPAQKSQQKMMSTIMPLFLGFIFYTFASGLTLYFTMFYLFSAFTQWKMNKKGKVK